MKFAIIAINPKDVKITKESLSKETLKLIEAAYPITQIDYSTFKNGTESNPISLYIMQNNSSKSADNMTSLNEFRDAFKTGIKIGSYKMGAKSRFDFRYLILDTHDITELGYKYKFALRININEKAPLSQYSLLNDIAAKLSEKYIASSIIVGNEANCEIEGVTSYEYGKKIYSTLTRNGSGAIGQFTAVNKISINTILGKLDENIEVLMAPKDLVEFEEMLKEFEASKKYIQTLSDSVQTRELVKINNDISDITVELDRIKKNLLKEPKVATYYLKIYDMNILEKFKLSNIKFKEETKEKWN